MKGSCDRMAVCRFTPRRWVAAAVFPASYSGTWLMFQRVPVRPCGHAQPGRAERRQPTHVNARDGAEAAAPAGRTLPAGGCGLWHPPPSPAAPEWCPAGHCLLQRPDESVGAASCAAHRPDHAHVFRWVGGAGMGGGGWWRVGVGGYWGQTGFSSGCVLEPFSALWCLDLIMTMFSGGLVERGWGIGGVGGGEVVGGGCWGSTGFFLSHVWVCWNLMLFATVMPLQQSHLSALELDAVPSLQQSHLSALELDAVPSLQQSHLSALELDAVPSGSHVWVCWNLMLFPLCSSHTWVHWNLMLFPLCSSHTWVHWNLMLFPLCSSHTWMHCNLMLFPLCSSHTWVHWNLMLFPLCSSHTWMHWNLMLFPLCSSHTWMHWNLMLFPLCSSHTWVHWNLCCSLFAAVTPKCIVTWCCSLFAAVTPECIGIFLSQKSPTGSRPRVLPSDKCCWSTCCHGYTTWNWWTPRSLRPIPWPASCPASPTVSSRMSCCPHWRGRGGGPHRPRRWCSTTSSSSLSRWEIVVLWDSAEKALLHHCQGKRWWSCETALKKLFFITVRARDGGPVRQRWKSHCQGKRLWSCETALKKLFFVTVRARDGGPVRQRWIITVRARDCGPVRYRITE